jgi:heptosyltransferase-2/heptosyltransferase-3
MNFPGLDPAWTWYHQIARTTGFIRPWNLPRAQQGVADGEKILVVASTALGDSLLTTPLFETLSQRLGRERTSLLVKAPFAELYAEDPRLHRVFTVRGKYRWAGLKEKLKADPHRIALIANMTEPDLIPYLWRCGVRGFLRYRSRWTRYPFWIANDRMLRKPGAPDYASGHAIENNLAMAKALGLEPTTHLLSLPHLRAAKTENEELVLIHPGASREIKRWAVENWALVADTIAAKHGCRIAITGDRGEVTLAAAIAARMKTPAQIVAGKLSLTELARLQARALAFLSGDTGPYHLALAVGCPTVTLFAPTDRGSSTEACGPHQAHASFHRALQTEKYGDSIFSIPPERVLIEADSVVTASRQRRERAQATSSTASPAS